MLQNKSNSCSIFEIYENNSKIECIDEIPSIFILKKYHEYKFVYYPSNNELIINFNSFSSNDFLDRSLYGFDSQNIYLNYYLKNKKSNDILGLFFDINGKIKINGYFSNVSLFDNKSFYEFNISTENKYLTFKNYENLENLNINLYFYFMNIYDFKIYEINDIIIVNKFNFIYNLTKGKNILFILDQDIKRKGIIFDSLFLLSIKNRKNIIKIINSEEFIITIKNFFIENIINIKQIFIHVEEDDFFEMKLIPEKISKTMEKNIQTLQSNIIQQNIDMNIEYIYQTNNNLLFYENINYNNLQIFKLNDSLSILDSLINPNFDKYEIIPNFNILEPFNSYIFLKKCKNKCMYMKYISNDLNFEYFLDESQILYLFMDFEYKILYNNNITNLKIKKLNNYENELYIVCNNIKFNIELIEEIVDLNKCNGEFIIKGNNNLIYIYLPITLNNNYQIYNNITSFNLNNIKEFFFMPNIDNYNSININMLNKDFVNNNKSIFFEYNIDYNIIPYSKNIEKSYKIFEEKVNIIVPNYPQNYDENYFIYFNFESNISKLEITINYENIISMEEKDSIIFINAGTNILQLENHQNYYIYILKSNESDLISYSIYRNDLSNDLEQNLILNSDYIYINSTSYEENIKIKIENKGDIFFSFSSAPFYDFSGISYDTEIYMDYEDNILNIKFNTTNYETKIEYFVVITDNLDNNINNISNYLYHKIINNESFIYKNIICSIGVEPILIELNIDEFFNYDIPYIIYILGKENFGSSLHYIYYEPKKFIITIDKPEEEIDEKSDEQAEEKTDDKSDEQTEEKTDDKSDEQTEEENEDKQNNEKSELEKEKEGKDYKNSNKNYNSSDVGLIVGIIIAVIGFFGIILFCIYLDKKKNKDKNIIKEINDLDKNLIIN